mgnify:CR=1 FL=1
MTTRPYVPRQPAPTMAAIPIMRFDPRASGLERWLGPLEAACMEAVYEANALCTVKRVWRRIGRGEYTTVMTTMCRLAKKGLLRRRRDGLAYVYDSTCTKEEFIELQIAAIVRSVEA